MRRILSLVSVFAACSVILAPGMAGCGDHLVAPVAAHEDLTEASARRQQDVRVLEGVLASPAAARAAARLGLRVERLNAAVPTLGDGEIHDLAARAAKLRSDPAARLHERDPMVHDFLVIFLIVATVAILINAAD